MNLKHHFLIAMPSIKNPLFRRSVVYIYQHSTEGAMGILINKPIHKYTIKNILNKLKINIEKNIDMDKLNHPVLFGGPLSDDRSFILHSPCYSFKSSVNISREITITTSNDIFNTIGTSSQPEKILVALGCSEWGKGQLEQEVIHNAWITTLANLKILFNTPIYDRWYESAKIIGIDIRNISSEIGHS
ncbi:yqgE [Wigglesworthia glossinidia endosymbiont of Glossina brevipalpis]|uniref:UPF0301 protein WIGBR1650 n=1 Tax=Wigglesworthia glossinidia brevipalpis TaxID=36870 RepID=Y165_WIGBR|nr:RecName: Full=UPF0301 protein WIGBR1650 [Wigglesworthia glossinidia endosymbiont of Glossina brevipalpis]BAC24311.1 yqgE [Wigglesworthia glossinidia endosymbiont of Glossina brevipalpis]